MCGRFSILTYDEMKAVADAVKRRQELTLLEAPRPHAKPGSVVHALIPQSNSFEIEPFTWGFESNQGKKLVFNTRLESALAGSPLWAQAFQQGRCIVPVASFFEPHATQTERSPRTGRPMKRQYEFSSASGSPLLIASVRQDDRLSIVTTEPNAAVSPIHKRMPLILRFEEVDFWLSGSPAELADRAGIALNAAPEHASPPKADSQLSLF